MKKSFIIIFSLLLFTLAACTGGEAPPVDPDQNNPGEETTPPTLDITLALADELSRYEGSLYLSELETLSCATVEEAVDALLEGEAHLALISAQAAADLYRAGREVQIVAVVAPGDPDVPDSMACLLATKAYLLSEASLLPLYLENYEAAVETGAIPGLYLATGWDMMDLVQQELEEQYAAAPDPSRTIPDGNFYYIPS